MLPCRLGRSFAHTHSLLDCRRACLFSLTFPSACSSPSAPWCLWFASRHSSATDVIPISPRTRLHAGASSTEIGPCRAPRPTFRPPLPPLVLCTAGGGCPLRFSAARAPGKLKSSRHWTSAAPTTYRGPSPEALRLCCERTQDAHFCGLAVSPASLAHHACPGERASTLCCRFPTFRLPFLPFFVPCPVTVLGMLSHARTHKHVLFIIAVSLAS